MAFTNKDTLTDMIENKEVNDLHNLTAFVYKLVSAVNGESKQTLPQLYKEASEMHQVIDFSYRSALRMYNEVSMAKDITAMWETHLSKHLLPVLQMSGDILVLINLMRTYLDDLDTTHKSELVDYLDTFEDSDYEGKSKALTDALTLIQ